MSEYYNEQALTLDFVKDTIKSVLVKQYDKNTRFIIVKCSENGVIKNIDKSLICNVKILTPDDRAIYNTCEILSDGSIKVPLSESALFSSGVAKAELNIIGSNYSSRIATMTFQIIIKPSVYKDDRIIDSDEFSALTELYDKASKDYSNIVSEVKKSANEAKTSEDNAKNYANNAKTSETNSKTSEQNSLKYSNNAKAYQDSSLENSKQAQESAETAIEKAQESLANANNTKNDVLLTSNNAKNSLESEQNASLYSSLAKSYAVGDSKAVLANNNEDEIVSNSGESIIVFSRDGEDTDNAKYYYESSKKLESSTSSYSKAANLSEQNAKTYASNAQTSQNASKISETNALNSEKNAKVSEQNSKKYYDDTKKMSEEINSKIKSMTKILSQNEYNALSSEEKMNGTIYFIN